MKLTRSINRRTQRSFRRIEFDFPRPNIIMSGGKREEPAEIYFEYREFKNLILLQNNIKKFFEVQYLSCMKLNKFKRS